MGLPALLTGRLAGGGWLRTAHRGAPTVAPGNTAAAVEAALEIGVDLVEVDVHATADGRLVLWHDDEVVAASGLERVIRHSSLAELQALEVGGHRVMTLEDGLRLARGRAGLMVDLKADGLGERIVEAARALDFSPVVVCGSYWATMNEVKRLAPEVGTSLTLTYGWQEEYGLEGVAGIDTDAVTVDGRLLSAAFVDELHTRGLPVLAWTIDRLEDMRALLGIGVDGLTSNRPDLFASVSRP